MKIALVCPYNMFERSGGVNEVVSNLAAGLRKKGHNITIITSRPVRYKQPAPPGYLLLGKCRRMNTGFGTVGDVTFEIDNEEVKEAIEREKFDVINFHEPWVPMLARQILLYSKAAHVATFHANMTENLAAKSFTNIFTPYGINIAQKMHVFSATSPAAAGVLLNKRANDEMVRNLRYIPNGIDLKIYKPLKKRQSLSSKDTKTIVYVGRLEKRKGLETLLSAFSLLSKQMPETHLIIAGKGNRLSRLLEIIDTLKIPNVSFAGYIDDEEKRRLIGNADVFCSPALFGEGFGIVLLEAMAMGTPIVAGRNSGYINVLKGTGRLGLVDPEATADFADRLSLFLSVEKIRRLYRDWELSDVKQYDYPKIVSQYEATYKEALNKWKSEQHLTENSKNGRFHKIRRRFFIRRHAR